MSNILICTILNQEPVEIPPKVREKHVLYPGQTLNRESAINVSRNRYDNYLVYSNTVYSDIPHLLKVQITYSSNPHFQKGQIILLSQEPVQLVKCRWRKTTWVCQQGHGYAAFTSTDPYHYLHEILSFRKVRLDTDPFLNCNK